MLTKNNTVNYFLTIISIGLILSFTNVLICLAFSQAVYNGFLAGFLAYGTALTLAGSSILILVITLLSRVPIAVARPQDEPLPLLIVMVQTIALHFSNEQAAILTVLTCIVLTTSLTGFLLFFFGAFRWGNFARFVPFPVIAGFLAGTGLLLINSGFQQVIVFEDFSWQILQSFFLPNYLLIWVPSVMFGLVLFFVSERFQNPLLLPGLTVTAILLFYLIFFLSGETFSSLKSAGLLLQAENISTDKLISHLNLSQPIAWHLIKQNIGTIIIISIVSAIALLFITMSLELILGKEIDFNKELKVAGLANVLSGGVGGLVGYHGLGNSLFSAKFQLNSRIIGLICAVACFLALFFANKIINYCPRFMLIGLIIFLGVSLFYKWTFGIQSRLSHLDKILVLVVILIMTIFGFLQGILAGIIIAMIFFTFTYSQLDVIRYVMNGKELSSSHEREPTARMIIKNNGEKIIYFKLQNYLFFGSANELVNKIQQLVLNKKHSIDFVIYDMERVSGIDSSAMMSFERIHEYAIDNNFKVILTGLTLETYRLVKKKLINILFSHSFLIIANTDDAINYCELSILQSAGYDLKELNQQRIALEDFLGNKSYAQDIALYFEDIKLNQGDYLVGQEELSHDLFYLESGGLTVFIQRPDNRKKILSIIGPGNFIGEVAFYLHSPRSASIVAEKECVLKKLSQRNFKKMKKEKPELANSFEQAIICLLSLKLIDTTKKVEILSK